MKTIRHSLIIITAALLAVAGAGCSSKVKKNYYLERANRWFDAGQFDKAEIEYLNVLHVAPLDPDAIGKLGIIYFDEGRFQKAAPFLFKGSQLATNNLELHLKLAQIYLAVGQFKDAGDEARIVLEKNPQDTEAPVILARSASKQKDMNSVEVQLHAMAQHNDSAAVETGLGILATRTGDFKTALADFKRALALNSHFAETYAAVGNLFWMQNDLKKAETSFKAAADCAPPRSLLQLQYGHFEIQAGNFTNADAFFTDITSKTPDYIPAWLGLAEVALDEKKLDDCTTALNKVFASDSENVDGQVLNARLDLARTNITKATSELERLAKMYRGAPRIHYQLALAYIMGNQLNKSLNQLHEAADLDPNFIEANFLLAQLELKTGDFQSAIDVLKQLTARQPDMIRAKLFLADAYRLQGDYNDALTIYQQLEKAFPRDAEIPVLVGSTFVQQLNEAAARQEFNRALQIDPENLNAQEELAQLDLADHQYSAAQERIEKIISKNPHMAQPQVLMAKIFLTEGQTNAAEGALEKAAPLPGGSSVNSLLAELYFKSKQNEKALRVINGMLENNPKDVNSLMLAGIIQSEEKHYSEAADSYEKLLAINPQYSPALNNLAWLYCDNIGDLDKAYDLAQRARQLLPTDPSTADTLGWVLFKKGQYLSALKLFQTSTNGLSDNPEIQFHIGIAHYMLGDEEASRDAFSHALNLGTTFPERSQCQDCIAILNIDPKTADAAARANLEKRISEKPNDPVAFSRLVAIYQLNKDSDKAIALCNTILNADPQNVKADVILAQLYAPTDPQKAFALAKKAYQLEPDDTEVCATLGRLAFQNGNDSWAFTLLDKAAQDQSGNPKILFDFANVAFSVGKVQEAQTAMANVLKAGATSSESTNAQNFLDMIALYQTPEQAVASETRIEEILASNPENLPALFAEAIVKTQQGNPVGAEHTYEQFLSRHPDCTLAQKNLAILYAQNLTDPDKAYPVALKAREAFPDDPQVAKALALILFQRGDYLGAANIFNGIASSASADAELFYCLGISEFHLKNYVQSRTSLQRALSLNLSGPQATDARQTLAELKN